MSICIQNDNTQDNLIILNNYALLFKDFEYNKAESNIYVLTSWVVNSKGRYKPIKNSKFKASRYNFSIKTILSELFITDTHLCLNLKIIHINESEITLNRNDFITLQIDKNILLHGITNLSILFSSYFDINKIKNGKIKLYNFVEYHDVDNINYLTVHVDDEDDPNYFDIDELKEQINEQTKRDFAQLDAIKNWIIEKRDIYDIIKELKRFIREMEN